MADVGKFFIGAVLTGVGIALGVGTLGFGSPVTGLLIAAGAGLMQMGLFGLPEFQDGIQSNVTSTQAPLPVIYGETKVGHAHADVRQRISNADFLHIAGAICVASENGGGIEGIESIWMGDDIAIPVPTFPNNTIDGTDDNVDDFWTGGITSTHSFIKYNLHAGTDAQTVDLMLNDSFPDNWPSTSTGKGIAYSSFSLEWDDSEERRWGGIPTINYTVRGNRVYDPRYPTNGPDSDGYCWDAADSDSSLQIGTNGYADLHPGRNPALILYDYLVSERYGLGIPADRIDTQSFIDHANYCDEEVILVGVTDEPSQARYQADGALSTGDDHKTNVEKILSSQNANLVWAQGKVFLMPRKPTTAESFTLNDDNILGGISVTRSGISTPNTIRARFPNVNDNYSVMDVVWPEPGTNDFLEADNDWESELEIDLPLTTNYHMAQHLAMIALRELREDVTISLEATEDALVLQPGHVVPVTYDSAGWDGKEFRVISMELTAESTVHLALREYDNGVYSLDPQDDEPTVPGTNLPNPFVVIPATGVTAGCNESIQLSSGELVPAVRLQWTQSTDPFAEWEEPVYREFTSAEWIHSGRRVLMDDTPNILFTAPFEIGKTYSFAIVTYNHLGRASPYAVSSNTCQIEAPDEPSPGDEIEATLNCEFDDGSYWATDADSTGEATTTSTTVGNVDFIFDAASEIVTIIQVGDNNTDITKTI